MGMPPRCFSIHRELTRLPARQRGGMFLGIVIGLLVGLGAALAVALYVTKVPVPFVNKTAPKSNSEQDAEEAKKNKNWDPNAPLYGKNPAKPTAANPSNPAATPTASPTTGAPVNTATAPKPAAQATPATPAAAPATATPPSPAASTAKAAAPKASSADPLGDLAKAKTNIATGAEPFSYFVQAGAFTSQADAEAQRAKLGISGYEAKITEREQSGRTVYRVRVGPLNTRDEADKTKEKIDGAGFETNLVRVQR